MLDITLCYGGECPFKYECYRFTAEYYGRQDFFGSAPYQKKGEEISCEHFQSNENQIQKIAYLIWEKEGKPFGKNEIHWKKAKENIKNNLK